MKGISCWAGLSRCWHWKTAQMNGARSSVDRCTLSNYLQIQCKSLQLDLSIDFVKKSLTGSCTWKTETLADDVKEFVLDTAFLEIAKAVDISTGKELQFRFQEKHPFGKALIIGLPEALRAKGSAGTIRVYYHTQKDASAIQWLEPSQTADKQHPYVYTQCEAIHARSLVPCQDTPAVKFTYESNITVQKPLVALMGAVQTGSRDVAGARTIYSFAQKVPIPSYLLALAAGALESRELSPRTKVWSEKSVVDLAAYEFGETDKFMNVAEELLGPYVWGRYDILCMPPSFPFGGMENPCLTFVTPTLLAGDRSLVNTIAHELMHSWMGNLVTNRTWEDFWLNEGHTVYCERRILEKVYGRLNFHVSATVGLNDLKHEVSRLGDDHPYTALVPQLEGVDPDDAFSSVPYEKGFSLLQHIANIVGIDTFDGFLRAYVDKFKYQSIGTDDWKAFLLSYFAGTEFAPKLAAMDWEAWFTSPGMPLAIPPYDTQLIDKSHALADRWIAGGAGCDPSDIEGWTTNQKVIFIDALIDRVSSVSPEMLSRLDATYKLSQQRNSEVRHRWCMLCVKAGYAAILPLTTEFLKQNGRMKFVRVLYRELFNSTFGKDEAVRLFTEVRAQYHPVAVKMIAKDLNLSS